MNPFKYSDEQISVSEFMILIPSMVIGVSIHTLPSAVAQSTLFADGWISILIAGLIFTFIAILGTKVAALFHDKSFLTYTSILVTKPVAIVLAFINIFIAIFLSALSIRNVAFISQRYLFDHTPMEVLALSFLLVVVYAVSGSRAGVLRLNVLFLPIILFAFIFVGLFNIKWIDPQNLLPMFQTSAKGYVKGMMRTFEAFSGFYVVLFYVFLINKPKKLSKNVFIGMGICIVFYILVFLTSIAIFGNPVTKNLEFPTIELAKRIDIPGGIFERIDALIFTIWIMAIFNTTAIAMDVGVLLLTSIFKKMNKKILTFILAPIIYYIALFPQQLNQVKKLGSIVSQFTVYFTSLLIVSLFLIAKLRGVKSDEKN